MRQQSACRGSVECGPVNHPFVGSRCLLRTHHVPSSLGTERYTQPQPCPAGAYSPASWAQTGGRTAHLAGGSPAVFTLTSSVMPTASPHPATRISAMVIMGLCGIAQLSDPPSALPSCSWCPGPSAQAVGPGTGGEDSQPPANAQRIPTRCWEHD